MHDLRQVPLHSRLRWLLQCWRVLSDLQMPTADGVLTAHNKKNKVLSLDKPIPCETWKAVSV